MILTGLEIAKEVEFGRIVIKPFNRSRVNPNSYNLTLAPELWVYDSDHLDMKREESISRITLRECGYDLQPNRLYLGRTNERTFTKDFVPMLEGRSSIGRLGLFIHVTAGFGDLGFNGFWTLELHCVQPIRIYPNIEIAQIYFHTSLGEKIYYGEDNRAKYNFNDGVQPSYLYREFEKDNK